MSDKFISKDDTMEDLFTHELVEAIIQAIGLIEEKINMENVSMSDESDIKLRIFVRVKKLKGAL